MEYWNETLLNSICIMGFLRLLINSSVSRMVNSAILVWGLKQGDKLMSILYIIRLLYMFFFKIPKSHGTVMIDYDGIRTN